MPDNASYDNEEWRVTWVQNGRHRSRTFATDDRALAQARFLIRCAEKGAGYENVRIWRRELGPWGPKYQSEFPGERP